MEKIIHQFTTSIARVYVYDSGMGHVELIVDEFPKERLEVHYEELERHVQGKKYPYVFTFKKIQLSSLTHEARSFNNEMLAKYCVSVAAITEYPMLRIFVNLYARISNTPFKIKTFPSMEEAKAWSAQFCEPKAIPVAG